MTHIEDLSLSIPKYEKHGRIESAIIQIVQCEQFRGLVLRNFENDCSNILRNVNSELTVFGCDVNGVNKTDVRDLVVKAAKSLRSLDLFSKFDVYFMKDEISATIVKFIFDRDCDVRFFALERFVAIRFELSRQCVKAIDICAPNLKWLFLDPVEVPGRYGSEIGDVNVFQEILENSMENANILKNLQFLGFVSLFSSYVYIYGS